MLTCAVCRGATFDETEEGFYVCLRCGTQSQDVVRETQDEELAFNTAGARGSQRRRVSAPAADARLRILRGDDAASPFPRGGTSGVSSDVPPPPDSRAPLEHAAAYCDAVQRLLRAQCDALERLAACPRGVVADAARRVWFAYLDETRLLRRLEEKPNPKPNPNPNPKKSKPTTAPGGLGGFEDDDEEEERVDVLGEGGGGLRAYLLARVPPRVAVSVAYLAALYARAPVHPGDFESWVAEGALPYRSAHAVTTHDGEDDPKDDRTAFEDDAKKNRIRFSSASRSFASNALLENSTATRLPSAYQIASGAIHVARATRSALGAFPPANGAALIRRFVRELRLGRDVEAAALRALAMHAPPGLRLVESSYETVAEATDEDEGGGEGGKNTRPPPSSGRRRRRKKRAAYGSAAPPHAHALGVVVSALKLLRGLTMTTRSDEKGARSHEGGARRSSEAAATVPGGVASEENGPWARWARGVFAADARPPFWDLAGEGEGEGGGPRRGFAARGNRSEADAVLRRLGANARSAPPGPLDAHAKALWRAYEEETEEIDEEIVGAVEEAEAEAENASAPPLRSRALLAAPSARSPEGPPEGTLQVAPVRFASAAGEYRIVVEACAALARVAPEALHECVRDADLALERWEEMLEEEGRAVEAKRRKGNAGAERRKRGRS